MTITLRDLLEQPYLSVDLLAGQNGTTRVVTWAHSSDLVDPWHWLSGGELVMKNGRTLPDGGAEQISFVEGLIAAGASGLLIGLDRQTPRISPRVIARCDVLGFPLLTVPYSLAFTVVGRAVAEGSAQDETVQLARAGRIYGLLRDAIASMDWASFFRRLQYELACATFLVDAGTATSVLDGSPGLPAGDRQALLTVLRSGGQRVPGVLRAEVGSTELLAVDVPYEVATLLIVKPPNPRPLSMATLRHAAAAAAVVLASAALRAEWRRERGTEIMSQLLDSHLDDMAARAELAAQQISSPRARLLATAWPTDRPARPISLALSRRGVAHILLERDDKLLILLGQSPDGDQIEQVQQILGQDQRMGVSGALRSTWRLPEAAQEATWALATAEATDQVVAYYGSSSSAFGPHTPAEAQALVDAVLRPVIDYDKQQSGDLFTSLDTFLKCDRSWVRTAQSLHVHKQTVVYRMRRVEQLTGRDLASTSDIAEIWLALTAFWRIS